MHIHTPAQQVVDLVLLLTFSFWFVAVSLRVRKGEGGQGHFYFGRGNSLWVGSGTVTLLAYWVTANTLMAAPETTYYRGVVGSIGYALVGGVGLICFAPLARRLKRVVSRRTTIGDFFRERYGPRSYHLLIITQVIYAFGVLITQGVAGKYALHDVMGLPNQVALVFVLAVTMAYTAIGGFDSVIRVGFIQVFLILVVIVIVPVYIYLKFGVHDIYLGVVAHAPQALHPWTSGTLVYLLAGVVMGTGEVFMDNGFWQRAFAIRGASVMRAFVWSGLIWMGVPLSISTLAFVALAERVHVANAAGIAPLIANTAGGWAIGTIMLIGVWAAVTSTIGGFLNSVVSILLHDVLDNLPFRRAMGNERRVARITTVVVAFTVYLFCMTKDLSLYNTLTFLGVLNAALIPPIAFGVYGERLGDKGASTAMTAAIAGGYIVYFAVGAYSGILISLLISVMVTGMWSLFSPAYSGASPDDAAHLIKGGHQS